MTDEIERLTALARRRRIALNRREDEYAAWKCAEDTIAMPIEDRGCALDQWIVELGDLAHALAVADRDLAAARGRIET